MIKPERLVKLYCIFPNNSVELVANSLQTIGLVHLYDIKEENPSLNPLEVSYKKQLIDVYENMKKLKSEVESKSGKKPFEWLIGPRYAAIETSKKDTESILKDAKKLLKEIKEKYGEINKKNSNEIKRNYYSELLSIYECLEDSREKIKALDRFGETKYTASFGGFTTKEEISKVLNVLDTATKGRCAFETKDAVPEDNPPTKLLNLKFVRPFEILTENYGMPPYNGIDPTFILAITFTFLFGLMFPDIGYGIMLAALSLLVYFLTRKTTKFIRNLNIILMYAGISSAFFGFLFGEFFGGFVQIKPFLFEPAKDILAILFISILIGILHISIGLISGIVIKKHRWHNIGLLISLWSIVFFIYTKNNNFLFLLAGSLAMLIYIRGFFIIEEILAMFSHVLSYLRVGILVILSVITSRLLLDTYLGLPKNFIGIILGVLLIIIGVLFSFVIGIVSVFIQSLRLHWLEFFSSYEFGGKKFKPFGYKREYLYSIYS